MTTAIAEQTITVEQFNREICKFREAFCSKSFWAKDNQAQRDIAFSAIGLCYLRVKVDSDKQLQTVATTLTATMNEYAQREAMIVRFGLNK